MEKIKQFLDKNKIEYVENFDLSSLSSIKLGSLARLAIFPKSVSALESVLMFLHTKKHPFKIFGGLSNVLFVQMINVPVIITSKMKEEVKIEGNYVTASAGVMIPKFCDQMRRCGLSGVEGLIGIPATIGGAIKNNAGAYGFSISDKLVKIRVFKSGKIFDIFKNQIKFLHHYSNLTGFVILEASFLFEFKNEYDIISLSNKFTYLRGKSQPSGLSLGSVFKKVNSKSAGFYIERSGLKGLREGGIIISSKHANFFVNDRNGSASDILHLISKVQASVEKQFGVELVPEIEKVGDFNDSFSRPSYSFEI